MVGIEKCNHKSIASVAVLQGLPNSQGGTGRHKCAVCSYQKGFEDAQLDYPIIGEMEDCPHGNSAPLEFLKNLQDSQAGAGRHKCVVCAYKEGFEAGKKDTSLLISVIENISPGKLTLTAMPGQSARSQTAPSFKGNKILNRSYREERNAKLGKTGELLVIQYERKILEANGRKDLADAIVHVSEKEGDGAGYDIKSYKIDGTEKYIEVKTTRGDNKTPFFITFTELEFSKAYADKYCLYRVFEYEPAINTGKFYVTGGDIEKSFDLQPIVFRVMR